MNRLTAILIALAACGTDEPTDARSCDDFTGHMERVTPALRCGVSVEGLAVVRLGGTPIFVEPISGMGTVEGSGDNWETHANRWDMADGVGAAVVLEGEPGVVDGCQWLRCEYTR